MTTRVLVVDDDEASAKTTGWTLEALGADIRIATDADTAIELAKSYRPHLMLLDINIPRKNGYEIKAELETAPEMQETVFVAKTGWSGEEHRRRSAEAGFKHHLVKPVSMDQLKHLLESVTKHFLNV